tara:strand:+ start:2479 stop:3123 length:645 start_codon:yes stop_codon:yes gene_type:complete
MRILIFDTETSGLFPRDGIGDNPYMIQLACIMYDTYEKKIINTINSIIKINFEISEEVSKLTGITNDKIRDNGKDINDILDNFNNLLNDCDILVAHNMEFDLKVMKTEMDRNNKKLNYSEDAIRVRTYCTMKKSIHLCKIQKENSFGKYYKWPKLEELHKWLFNQDVRNLHDAYNDVLVCLRCYVMINCSIDVLEVLKEDFRNILCEEELIEKV